jgi:hypothetical protein
VRWTVRRAQARRAVIASFALLVGLTTFLLTGIAGYSAHAGVEGLRDYLTAPGSGVALAMQTRLSDDPKAQQAAADAFFAKSFAGIDVEVYTSLTLPPQAVSHTSVAGDIAPADAPTIRIASFDDFLAHATVTAGSWSTEPQEPQPAAGTDPQPAALSAGAAHQLGVRVGDTIAIGNATRQTFRIDAIWAPTREGDPFFEADAAGARSADDLAADQAAAGFLVVPRPVVAAKGSSAQANWTVVPNPDTITPAGIPALAAAAAEVPQAFRNPNNTMAPHGGLVVDDLSAPLLTVSDTLGAASSVNPVPSLLVAAIGLVMIVQLARLLAIERRRETALIRSRGGSTGQLTRLAAVEAATITVPAAILGAGSAAVGLQLAGASWPSSGWWIWPAAALTGALVITLPAAHQARATANRQNIDDSGRIRALAAGSTVALVLIAAAISLWRFRHLGAAAFVGADGATHLDPIAVLAPALVLIAGAVVAGVIFGALAALVEATAARLRGIGTVLAARQVARRATVYGIAVLLLAISVGGTALAASYAPTQLAAQQQTDALRNGGQVLVEMPDVDPQIPSTYQPADQRIAALPQVGHSIGVISAHGSLGAQPVDIAALPAGRLGQVVGRDSGFDVGAVAAELATDPVGSAIPKGATALTIAGTVAVAWGDPTALQMSACGTAQQNPVKAQPGPGGLTTPIGVVVWIRDADGRVLPLSAGTVDAAVDPTGVGTARPMTLTVPLAGLPTGAHLLGMYFSYGVEDLPMVTSVRVTSIRATTGQQASPVPLGGPGSWLVQPPVSGPSNCTIDGKDITPYAFTGLRNSFGVTGTIPPQTATVVQLVTRGVLATVPVVIDRQAADLLDLQAGDQVILALDGARSVPARIGMVSDVLPGPGTAPKVMVDLGALGTALLSVSPDIPGLNQYWIASSDPAAVARAVVPLVPPTSLIRLADSRSAQALLTPASRTLWLGAIGAVVLAAIGVGSVIAVVSRSRRGELVALRASGITARRQARSRRRELSSVSLAGWLLGVGVGMVAVLATIPGLAGSAVVGSFGGDPPVRWDVSTAAWLIGGQVVVVVATILGYGVRLRRAALASTPSERSQSERDRRPKGRPRRAEAERAVEHRERSQSERDRRPKGRPRRAEAERAIEHRERSQSERDRRPKGRPRRAEAERAIEHREQQP